MTDVLTFLAVSIMIAITPGPSWLYVISRTLGQGSKAGMIAVAGNTTGIGIHMLGVVLGLSLVIQQSAAAFTTLKLAGALYLGYLGLKILWGGAQITTKTIKEKALSTVFSEAVLVNVTNPKVAILFLAFLPQFVDPAATNAPLRMAGFGSIHMVVAFLVTSGLVVMAKRISPAFDSSALLRGFFRWGIGTAFIAIAAKLALERHL